MPRTVSARVSPAEHEVRRQRADDALIAAPPSMFAPRAIRRAVELARRRDIARGVRSMQDDVPNR